MHINTVATREGLTWKNSCVHTGRLLY